jgi:hypothetical protein
MSAELNNNCHNLSIRAVAADTNLSLPSCVRHIFQQDMAGLPISIHSISHLPRSISQQSEIFAQWGIASVTE